MISFDEFKTELGKQININAEIFTPKALRALWGFYQLIKKEDFEEKKKMTKKEVKSEQ